VRKNILAALIALALSSAPALAAKYTSDPVPLTSGAWVDLGTGPLRVQLRSGFIFYVVADEAPTLSTVGHMMGGAVQDQAVDISTNKKVFARAVDGAASVVTTPIADAVVATESAAINISTPTTTQLVPLTAGQSIYVTGYRVVAGGTGNFRLVFGTGTNCGTGTTNLEGPIPLTAQAGLAPGGGVGAIYTLPVGTALCAVTSAAVQMSGSVSFAKF
jgi:hypothetical protein